MLLFDRIIICCVAAWLLILATVVVINNRAARITPDLENKIVEIHDWCKESLAPAKE